MAILKEIACSLATQSPRLRIGCPPWCARSNNTVRSNSPDGVKQLLFCYLYTNTSDYKSARLTFGRLFWPFGNGLMRKESTLIRMKSMPIYATVLHPRSHVGDSALFA